MAQCKLCLQDKVLINKSHIIPDFMYKDLLDDAHKMNVFSIDLKTKKRSHIKRPSTGEFEGGLLCANCDNKLLGGYEDYACKAIYGGNLPAHEDPICENYKSQDGIEFTICKNINYQKFKLFLLSILWRASISTRPLFNEISLGPHEETIRQMLFDRNAGDLSDYPFVFISLLTDKSVSKDLIVHPKKRRTIDGQTIYVFIIGGMIYNFYVNSKTHKLPDLVLKSTIKPSNEMSIIHLPPGQGFDLIMGFIGLSKT